eukprot:7353442-Prymnesium_polylepis.1
MGARNRSSFPAAARCDFRALVLLGGTSSARTGMAVVGHVLVVARGARVGRLVTNTAEVSPLAFNYVIDPNP